MRTNYCGEVTESQISKMVTICGWVHRRRDHGGVIFIDLRDRYGLVQVVAHPDNAAVFTLSLQGVEETEVPKETQERISLLGFVVRRPVAGVASWCSVAAPVKELFYRHSRLVERGQSGQ